MIKILIVDDDVEMLHGLENIIDWSLQGFEIVGKAENGVDALEIFQKTHPDIIMTDISMPLLDGLTLVKTLRNTGLNFKTILLTCHEDFHYAKEAISLNVEEYLVKYTLTEENLINVLQKLKLKIYEEEFQKKSLYKYSNEIRHNKNFFKKKILSDIMENRIKSYETLHDKAFLYNILIPDREYKIIGIFIDNYENSLKSCAIDDSDLLEFSICNIIEEIFVDVKNISLLPFDNFFILLYWDDTIEVRLKQVVIDKLRKVQLATNDILKIDVSICIGNTYDNIWRIKEAILDIKRLRESYFYIEGNKFIDKQKEFNLADVNTLYKKYCEGIKVLIENNEISKLAPAFDELFNTIQENAFSPNNVRSLFNKLLVDLDFGLRKLDLNIGNTKVEGETYSQCKNHLLEGLQFYIKYLEDKINHSYSSDVKKVIEYVNNNLDKDISLETVASYIYKNSSYLSRMFKKETGFNFSEYLIKKRIEKATFLLSETDIPVEEVCSQIGIENVYYFYRFYKKETGKTPGEARGKK